MAVNTSAYNEILSALKQANGTLVAVSKLQPISRIKELYDLGHRDFGENYVQELLDTRDQLPADIRWHFIGHLQSNKVKQIASFVHLIHGVDSIKLLAEINKQAEKNDRIIECLLQVHIANEESKFGFDANEIADAFENLLLTPFQHISVKGFMGMASFSENQQQVRSEFASLKQLFDKYAQPQTSNIQLDVLSMGMSGDYQLALEEGSNMLRVGSLLFGNREK